jgi:hypothetical protein
VQLSQYWPFRVVRRRARCDGIRDFCYDALLVATVGRKRLSRHVTWLWRALHFATAMAFLTDGKRSRARFCGGDAPATTTVFIQRLSAGLSALLILTYGLGLVFS